MDWLCIFVIVTVIIIASTFVRSTYVQLERISDYSKPSQIHQNLDLLLKKGFHCAYFIIEHDDSKKFLQVKKYIEEDTYGIELGFPKAEWSSDYAPMIEKLAKKKKLYCFTSDASEGGLPFIYVDFRQDVDAAANFCREVIEDIFGIKGLSGFTANHVGLAVGKNYPLISDHPEGYEFYQRHSS